MTLHTLKIASAVACGYFIRMILLLIRINTSDDYNIQDEASDSILRCLVMFTLASLVALASLITTPISDIL